MEAVLNENNLLMLIELIEFRKTIVEMQDEGECVNAELGEFRGKLEEFINSLKASVMYVKDVEDMDVINSDSKEQ